MLLELDFLFCVVLQDTWSWPHGTLNTGRQILGCTGTFGIQTNILPYIMLWIRMVIVSVFPSVLSPLRNKLSDSRYPMHICEFVRLIFHSVSQQKKFWSHHSYTSNLPKIPHLCFRHLLCARAKNLGQSVHTRNCPVTGSVQGWLVSHSWNCSATCRCTGTNCLWSQCPGMGDESPSSPPRRLVWVHFISLCLCRIKLRLPIEGVISIMQPTFSLFHSSTPPHPTVLLLSGIHFK